MKSDLVERLTERAQIRRQIQTRKSVQEGKPDRIADLLDEAAYALCEAADALEWSEHKIQELQKRNLKLIREVVRDGTYK